MSKYFVYQMKSDTQTSYYRQPNSDACNLPRRLSISFDGDITKVRECGRRTKPSIGQMKGSFLKFETSPYKRLIKGRYPFRTSLWAVEGKEGWCYGTIGKKEKCDTDVILVYQLTSTEVSISILEGVITHYNQNCNEEILQYIKEIEQSINKKGCTSEDAQPNQHTKL